MIASLLALACLSQDALTLEQVLDRMQERAPAADRVVWNVRTIRGGRDYMDKGFECAGVYHKREGFRVQVNMLGCVETDGHGAMPGPNRFTAVFTPDSVSVAFSLLPIESSAHAVALPHMLFRARRGDAAFGKIDPLFLPSGFTMLSILEEPILRYTLAPRLAFGLEPALRLEGRRGEHYVLVSHLDADDVLDRVPRTWYSVRRLSKTFYVRADNFLIDRVDMELLERPSGVLQKDVRSDISIRVSRRQPCEGAEVPLETLTTYRSTIDDPTLPPAPYRRRVLLTPADF